MTALLKLEQVSYLINGRSLLDGISLSVAAGEMVILLGRNGAGKSTLLNLISAELRPASGQIELFGQLLDRQDARQLAQKRAILTQSTPLTFDYTVLDVVLLGRLPHRRSDQDALIAQQCLKQVGLESFAERGYLSLSGGEQQRVHLARVLAQLYPYCADKLILLDEPTSSLDLQYQHETLRILSELKAQGVGVFAIVHDLNLAAQYADRMLLLAEGQILAAGKPEAVLTVENIAQAFQYQAQILKHPYKDCPLVV